MSPRQSEKPTQDPEPQSLADLFHRIGSLIPKGQKVLRVGPRATTGEALDLMRRHSYSQLPVVAGDTVVGVFSYRSLSMRLLQMGPLSQPIGESTRGRVHRGSALCAALRQLGVDPG